MKKVLSCKQKLTNELRKLKPHPTRKKIRITDVHFIPDSMERRKQELADVKKHIRTKFEAAVSDNIIRRGMTRERAEQEAFNHAMFRIESWKMGYIARNKGGAKPPPVSIKPAKCKVS